MYIFSMGTLFSRFKKKPTTSELLEGLEQEIKSIEENGVRAEQRQRRIVGHLILYSVGLYIIAAFLFYLFYFPAPLKEQIIYITPMLIFPILVVFLKKLVSWYYHRKLVQNQDKLQKMREKKKKILDEVMDKETYKKAKEILEKYAPDQLRKQSPQISPLQLKSTFVNTAEPKPQLLQQPAGQATSTDMVLRRRSVGQPAANRQSLSPPSARSMSLGPVPFVTSQADDRGLRRLPGPPMPRPVFPRERSYADKLMEYILGDGPSNRYALICKQCESHNGMALKEEFEYLAFRCCYCFYWNPARKQRPHAPALTQSAVTVQGSSTSSSELNSASDTEDEQPVADDSVNISESLSETPKTKLVELHGDLPVSEAVILNEQVGRPEESEVHPTSNVREGEGGDPNNKTFAENTN